MHADVREALHTAAAEDERDAALARPEYSYSSYSVCPVMGEETGPKDGRWTRADVNGRLVGIGRDLVFTRFYVCVLSLNLLRP